MRSLVSKLIGLLLLALVACTSVPPPAAESAAATEARRDPSAPAERSSAAAAAVANDGVLELSRRSVRSSAEWLARGVDSWFGDKPFEEGGKVTDGRLSVSLLKRQDESADFSVRFNARFSLPNVEETTYLFIGRDNEREVVADTPGAFSRRERLLDERSEDRSFFAGLGLALRDSVDLRLGVRGGFKPYAQARYRRPWQLTPQDLVEFRETIFWTVDERFGSTTALSVEHAFSSSLAARWLSAATISQDSEKFEWSSKLGLFKSFGGQRQLSLEALTSGKQGSGVGVLEYGVESRWQQPVYRNWLLGEIVVGHFWPRKDAVSARESVWAIGGGLKMRF